MALDKFLFKITPAPTGGNSSLVEWRAYLDEEQRNIIIWDAATNAEVCRIGSSSGMMELVGGWDASGDTYPIIGSGTADAVQKGDSYIITAAGTLGGTLVAIGDLLVATVDAPGQTEGNWAIENHGLGFVPAGSVFEKIISSGNVGGGEDTLYSSTLAANQFGTSGDRIVGKYAGTLANNVNAKVLKVSFGGTVILNSTGLDLASIAGTFDIDFTVIRTGADTARAIAKLYISPTLSVVTQTDIAGMNWATTKLVVLTGTGVADNDIVAKLGHGLFIPTSS